MGEGSLHVQITPKGRIAVEVQRAQGGKQTWQEATDNILKWVAKSGLPDVPDEELFAELRSRGWTFGPAVSGRSVVTPPPEQSERNTVPEDDWQRGWDYLEKASRSTAPYAEQLEDVWWAVQNLYVLLEPPSVRERRLNDG